MAPASFISSQGTPFVMSLNKKCIRDTGEAIKGIPQDCVALFYDRNGTNGPNMIGDDIVTMGLTPNNELPTLAILGGVKIKAVLHPNNGYSPLPVIGDTGYCTVSSGGYYNTKREYYDIGIHSCCVDSSMSSCLNSGDYWAGAMKACHDKGLRLPTPEELGKIASDLYNQNIGEFQDNYNLRLDTTKIPDSLSGFGSSWYTLWTSDTGGTRSTKVYTRLFDTNKSYFNDNTSRLSSYPRAFCVSD